MALNFATTRLRSGSLVAAAALAAVGVGLVAALAAGSTGPAAPAASGTSASATGLGFSGLIPPARRRPAAVLSGPLLGGGQLSTGALHGHVVVVNFWASWCTVCQTETPVLERAALATAPLGVHFVGVDVADSATAALAFRSAHHLTYPSLSNHQGTAMARFPGIPAAELPSTVLIDPQGRIAGTWVGAVNYAGLVRVLHSLAASAGAPAPAAG